MNFNTKKGFTLIELLLVLSIISLLSSVIISQVKDSRKKANLATVKQEMASLKTEAEIYYTNNNQRYTTFDIEIGPTNCPDAQQTPQWGFLRTEKGLQLIDSLKKRTGSTTATCAVSKDSYAVSVDILSSTIAKNIPLVNNVYANTDGYVCFDSSGRVVWNINETISGSDLEGREIIPIKKSGGKFVCS